MRILQIGSTGIIGRAVVAELRKRHEIIEANRGPGDHCVDIADPGSVALLFEAVGDFDALICTAGAVHFAALDQLTTELFDIGLRSKLMGQVNLVAKGLPRLRRGGSVTLTSGPTNEDTIREGAASALVNGALEGFVRAAAIELGDDRRINLVSPTVLEESLPLYGDYFPGSKGAATRDVVLSYVKSVEGAQTGRVYRVGWSRDF